MGSNTSKTMAAPPCSPSSLPELLDDLVEAILLLLPPDEPALLFRASVVCKLWRRIVTNPGFLRRYRAFHRAPPFLGYLRNLDQEEIEDGITPMAPTSVASPLSTQPGLDNECLHWWAVDCRHGRVLIRILKPDRYMVVWDPTTGCKKKLTLPNNGYGSPTFNSGAVLCDVDGCDHLDCHDGPFLVVISGIVCGVNHKTWVTIYSSETGLWSATISIDIDDPRCFFLGDQPSLLIGDMLYLNTHTFHDDGYFGATLKLNLRTRELSLTALPKGLGPQTKTMEVDGGGLGFVSVKDNRIFKWSWQGDATNGGIGGWAQHMVMDLQTLLPAGDQGPFCSSPYRLVGLLEGTDTIFIHVLSVGLFTLDLKSKKVKKLEKRGRPYFTIFPYTSFYTPDLSKA